jgi:hypothetical protein
MPYPLIVSQKIAANEAKRAVVSGKCLQARPGSLGPRHRESIQTMTTNDWILGLTGREFVNSPRRGPLPRMCVALASIARPQCCFLDRTHGHARTSVEASKTS